MITLRTSAEDFGTLAENNSSTKPFLQAGGRVARSARHPTPRLSRCFAKRTIEQCVLTSLRTIAFLPPHDVVDCTVRSHFGSIYFLFERARCFPVYELLWFCIVQVSAT